MGAAQRAAIQYFHYGKHVRQPMDDLDHYGMLRTHAKGQGINTDSAAGATAMATGEKTKRNYVGVDANGKPLKTLLEIADDEASRPRSSPTTTSPTRPSPGSPPITTIATTRR